MIIEEGFTWHDFARHPEFVCIIIEADTLDISANSLLAETNGFRCVTNAIEKRLEREPFVCAGF